MAAFLYLLAWLALAGILTLLADAQCHLRMSERDYGDWVALPDEARAAGSNLYRAGGRLGKQPTAERTSQDSHFHDSEAL
jgi:hypothetical protein